jgi:hypothetical protein
MNMLERASELVRKLTDRSMINQLIKYNQCLHLIEYLIF